MADLKPKRGWVYRVNFDAYLAGPPAGGRIFAVDAIYHGETCIPVLVIPDPDRDPTPEEIEALERRLYESGRQILANEENERYVPWERATGDVKAHFHVLARAAWRLGARVPS